MLKQQITQALKDIIPGYEGGPKISKLASYVDSMYHLSLRKHAVLPNNSEIGRYHLCTYVIAEKYQSLFDLPAPDITRIPIQPQVAAKLLDDFRDFINQLSAASTPNSSPKKPLRTLPILAGAPSTPTKTKAKQTSSPLKRLRQAADEYESDENDEKNGKNTNNNDATNTTNATGATSATGEGIQPFSPLRSSIKSPFVTRNDELQETNSTSTTSPSKIMHDNQSEFGSPSKRQKQSSLESPAKRKYRYDFKTVLITDFITFCNTFYVPAPFTVRMLSTFYLHKHKFVKKTDWSLACGIVYTAYTRINHQLLANKIGAKAEFMTLLLQYQKGGLLKSSLQSWCTLVEEWIKDESWVQDIEKQYVYVNETAEEDQQRREYTARVGRGWNLMERLGSMIHGEFLYQSEHQNEYYQRWTDNTSQLLIKGREQLGQEL